MITADRMAAIFSEAGLTEEGVQRLAQAQARLERAAAIEAIRLLLDARRAAVENELLNPAEADPAVELPTWAAIRALLSAQ